MCEITQLLVFLVCYTYIKNVLDLKIIKGMNIIWGQSAARITTKLVTQQPEHGQSAAVAYPYQYKRSISILQDIFTHV